MGTLPNNGFIVSQRSLLDAHLKHRAETPAQRLGDLNYLDARMHLPGCAEGWQILSFIRQPCLPPLLTVAVKKCHTMRPVGKVMYGEDMDVNIEKLATMSPSEVFETYMVPATFAPWTDALLDLTQLQAMTDFWMWHVVLV